MVERQIQDSFSLNLKVMRLFGFYSPDKRSYLYTASAYVMYFVFIVPVPLFGCLYLFLEEDVDFARVAENAFLLAEMGCYIVKFLPFIRNNEKIKKCILYLESPFFTTVNVGNTEILEECQRICQRNTRIFLMSVTGGVTSWAVKPLFWKDYRLPIDVWLPFNPMSTLAIYYSVYVYLVIEVAYAAYSSVVVNPLIAGLACQATGQLKILKYNLQRLAEKKNIYQEIKKCTEHHTAIISFVRMYEECFSLVVFSQFVGSIIVICVSCLQLTILEPLSFNFIAMIMFLIAMLAEIYLFCYYGTELYAESDTITSAIYMGQWYDYSIESQKALILLMERSKKPMLVTAGKILDLSLVTFTMILRRSYSLLAVLQNYK